MSNPDTIVLIHGFWVTPRSWEDWIAHYEGRGFTVLAPAYPGFEVEVEALNADPSPIEPRHRAADHRAPRVRRRRRSTRRRSSWGTRRAACSRRCCSTTGSAPPASRSTRRRPRASSACRCRRSGDVPRAEEPGQPAQGRRLHLEQWHYAFTNTFSEEESRRALRAVPHPRLGHDLLGQRAGQHPPRPGRHATSTTRTPTGRRCCSSPATRTTSCRRRIQRSNAKHYKPNGDHRGQGVRGAAPAALARRAGRRSPTTRSTGRSSTRRAEQASSSRTSVARRR